MLKLDALKFKLATLISIFRYIYLQYVHDRVYSTSNGYINGYVLVALLLYLLGVPLYLILAAVGARVVYRKSVGNEIVNTGNHPYNVIMFFIMILIVVHLTPTRP
jgi:hypothetical protein